MSRDKENMNDSHCAKNLVVGLDIGTSFTGYAYSFRSDPYNIIVKQWPTHGSASLSPKAPSSILLTPELNFKAFGYDAEREFAALVEEKEHVKWIFVQQFKMKLNAQQHIDCNTLMKDTQNHLVPILCVLTNTIQFLKDDALKSLTSRNYNYGADDILFVVTVPAMWSNAAKQIMRLASEKAGIKAENVVIALEPEVSALHLQNIPVHQLSSKSDANVSQMFTPDNAFLVLDIGGGTADITVQKVGKDGKLSQVKKASGGDWGGTRVNLNFFNSLTKAVGQNVMVKFKTEHMSDYLFLYSQVELAKRQLAMDGAQTVSIHLPSSLKKVAKRENQQKLAETLQNGENSSDLFLRDDKLVITTKFFKSFFSYSVQSIIGHVKLVVKTEQCPDIKHILMVGGFSESPIVNSAIKETFKEMTVIVPFESGLSVVKGAVVYGHNPQQVRFRVCPLTYGMSMYDYFNPSLHPLSKSCKIGNQQYIIGCFEKIFEINQFVQVGEKTRIKVSEDFTRRPESARTYNKEIEMYSSTEINPKYINDPGCKYEGKIIVPPPGGRWPDKMKGKIEFEIGGTEIKVQFTDRLTKSTSTGYINFTDRQDHGMTLERSFMKST